MSARRIWAKKALDLGKIYAFDVLKRLRAAAVKTPILILSVKAEPDDRVKGLGFGANDYLTKPFDRGELISRIKTLCHGNKARVQAGHSRAQLSRWRQVATWDIVAA